LTVVFPDGSDGIELVLEPMGFPPAKAYQQALFEAGIPLTAFLSNDIQEEHQQLKDQGLIFHAEPAAMGLLSQVYEDTCGNLINLVQPT
jgi:hypothetical protein